VQRRKGQRLGGDDAIHFEESRSEGERQRKYSQVYIVPLAFHYIRLFFL